MGDRQNSLRVTSRGDGTCKVEHIVDGKRVVFSNVRVEPFPETMDEGEDIITLDVRMIKGDK